MEHCKIEIKTHTKGTLSLFHAKGAFERTDEGVIVRYPHEGEEVVLSLLEETLTMERHSLSLRFERGKTSFARLKAGGHEGSLPLKTKFYSLMRNKDGISAALKYELGEPAQKFTLSIRVSPGSEER